MPLLRFNSHAQKATFRNSSIQHLLADLDQQLDFVQQRQLHSIFIGGGTPSLFSAESIAFLLAQIAQCIPFSQNIEITLEANPGTAEAERF